MLHCNRRFDAYLLQRNTNRYEPSPTMSKQLSVASTFSIIALCAVALLAPGSARLGGGQIETGATTEIAAPAFMAELPLVD
jgi:hypothetical protein